MISGHFLEKFINSPAHHTLHHLYFTCNYGQVRTSALSRCQTLLTFAFQYFTWADKYGGSYRPPREDLDPIHEALKNMDRKRKLAEKEAKQALREQNKQFSESSIDGDQESDSGYEGSEAELDKKPELKVAHVRTMSKDESKDMRRRR